jgi:hypothetical protein
MGHAVQTSGLDQSTENHPSKTLGEIVKALVPPTGVEIPTSRMVLPATISRHMPDMEAMGSIR